MEWFNVTIVISAGVLTLFNLIDRIIQYANKPKETTDELKRRIETLERKTDEDFKEKFDNYDKELNAIKESTAVIQRGLLALLKHSIDGNNTDGLKESEKELTDYLTGKSRKEK